MVSLRIPDGGQGTARPTFPVPSATGALRRGSGGQCPKGMGPGVYAADALIDAVVAGALGSFLEGVKLNVAGKDGAAHADEVLFHLIEHLLEGGVIHGVGDAGVGLAVVFQAVIELGAFGLAPVVEMGQGGKIETAGMFVGGLPGGRLAEQDLVAGFAGFEIAAQVDVENAGGNQPGRAEHFLPDGEDGEGR